LATLKTGQGGVNTANLSTSQTGTGASTNTLDRSGSQGAALLTITSVVGATPTVTVAIQGSADGVNWWSIPYATAVAPTTVVVAALTITTATTAHYIIQPNVPVQFVRLNLSANTNVTLTADVWF
jgi:hypothetical protein